MKKLSITKEDRDFLKKEYCLHDDRSLEPIGSFDIQPEDAGSFYIPSSDILFLRETDAKENKSRIVAYNIEFGIWTYSKWSLGDEMPEDLQMEAFRFNVEDMLGKILYAIEKKSFDSIFYDGEEFQPTLRGINTKIQTYKEHLFFKSKFEDSALPRIFANKKEMEKYKEALNEIKGNILNKFAKKVTHQ